MTATIHAEVGTAASYIPQQRRSLGALRNAARACRGCPLWQHATQTTLATVHPSSILRQPTATARQTELARFVHALSLAAKLLPPLR